MMLDHDPLAADPTGQQVVDDLGGCLGLGDPVDLQPGLLDSTTGLRTTYQDPGLLQRLDELLLDTVLLGGVHPPTETHTGGRHHDVRRVSDQRAGLRQQLRIIEMRGDRQRGSDRGLRAVTLQGGGELAGTTVHRKQDRTSGQCLG